MATAQLQTAGFVLEAQPLRVVFWSDASSPMLALRSPMAGIVDLSLDSPHEELDPYVPKVLAKGPVPVSPSRIYLCPAGKVAVVTLINFVNVSAPSPGTSELVILYFKRDTRIEIGRARLERTGWRFEYLETAIELEAGDALHAETTRAGAVSFVVTGLVSNAGGGP